VRAKSQLKEANAMELTGEGSDLNSAPESTVRLSGASFSLSPLGEYAQGQIRCAMNLVLVALACLACELDPSLEWRLVGYTFIFTALSALVLLIWARLIAKLPAGNPWRITQRIASIVLDNLAISWILYFGDQTLAGVFTLYLWVTIGYGVRYGAPYLYGSLAASELGFALVTYSSEFWGGFPALGLGLAVGLLVVPLYAGYLINLLYNALARAEAAARAKTDFVAKMSHELRTPLHGVIALTDLLSGDITESQRLEMTRLITTSSNTLLDLINRILDSAKYESGLFALHIEEMDLHQVLAETIDLLVPQSTAKGIGLSLHIDPRLEPHLLGSPRQIQEVITNLAGNAIKFTDRGGVKLAVTQATKHRKGTLVIRIVDTGPGMDQDYLIRVFDPFSQADDSVTRMHGGSGLGTTIARDLIQLMSGELRIRSAPGIGTRVEVELKLPTQPTSRNQLPELPQQMVLVGVGDQADAIKQLFKAVAELSFMELGMGEAQRILHTFEPRTCFVVSGDVTESVVLMLRAHWRLNGRQSLPVMIGFGLEAEREAAINLGLSAFLTDRAEHFEITNALRVADHLFPKRHTGYEPIESGIQGLILIAEDNSTNQIIARMTLERAGYRCHVVGDGERALDELQTGAYDLALIDMHMPILDGLDVARLYNFVAGPEPLRTPIVMVTADNRPDLVADADLVGITRFAIKPLRPSQLLQTVKELVTKRQVTLVDFDSQHVFAEVTSELASVLDDGLFAELMLYMNVPEAKEFFGEFAEDAERYISTVDLAMDGGVGATKMKDDMHALCGAARTVGAKRLAAISRRIEYSSESDEHYDPRTYSTELKQALSDVMEEIYRRLALALDTPQAD